MKIEQEYYYYVEEFVNVRTICQRLNICSDVGKSIERWQIVRAYFILN